ncbi:forkhead box protein I1c [Hydra vulgaris]|uniref:forkhead box protein I1c n=1 Tax=Hydra vulgaris TaxID=6087 RepID=UPI0002B4C582|nr:forkhead box protein I1c-like [Hydra vulgaris]
MNNLTKPGSYLPEQSFKFKSQDVLIEDKDNNLSYTAMIAQAIMVSSCKRLTLSEIYEYMANTFEILKKRGTGWRNCVRHTLSLNECFLKLHRPENGRSCNWTVHPAYFEAFSKGDYRKRRANRKKSRSVSWIDDRNLAYPQTIGLPYIREPDIRMREDLSRVPVNDQHTNTLWQSYASSPAIKPEQYHTLNQFPYDNRMTTLPQGSSNLNTSPFSSHSMHPYQQHQETQYPIIQTHNEGSDAPQTSRYSNTRVKDSRMYQNHMDYLQENPPSQYPLDTHCLTNSAFGTRTYRQDFF